VRRYPEIDGPAILLLFCLAPHGVFPAARITSRAVSSYLAFSPLPALFSKNRRYHFCDTFRRRNLTNATPAFFTRHAAVWCSDFPRVSLTTYQRSSAITNSLAQPGNPRNLELNRRTQLWPFLYGNSESLRELAAAGCHAIPSEGDAPALQFPDPMVSRMQPSAFISAIHGLFLFLIWSVYSFKPMREKELFLRR
jgi:hypothetical protein